MQFPQLTYRPVWARSTLLLLAAGLAAALAGCGPSVDAQSSSKSPSESSASKAKTVDKGFTLRGDGLSIDATASAALLPGYSGHPLSVSILGGWVDAEKIKLARQETDPAEQKKKAMGTFGTLKLHIAAGKAEPGTYQLGPEGKDPQGGTIVIDKAKDVGLADKYTSKSGTLTVKSVTMKGNTVSAIDGTFDGQFGSRAGDSRAFSGSFQFAPKK